MNNRPTQEGLVTEALPGTMFRVRLPQREKEILCHLSGKMRLHHIRVISGDKVLVELGPDGERGRIVRRV